MAGHGGARPRSGPPPDPRSQTSARRRMVVKALPADGYRGRIPGFPLPDATKRERDLWKKLWRTPVAAGWAEELWRWADPVADYCRIKARAEQPDAGAVWWTKVQSAADRIGLTPDGMARLEWRVGVAVVDPDDDAGPPRRPPVDSGTRGRLAAVPDAS
jgi:hypothetical protein